MTVSSTFVEAEIHDGMSQTQAVAVAHLQISMRTVRGVRGDGDVEGGHAGDENILLKGPVGHGDRFGGGHHGGPGGVEVGCRNFEVFGVGCGIGALKAPSTTVVLHLHTEGWCASFALEVPVKPVQHLISPVPPERVGVSLQSFTAWQSAMT